LRSYCEEIDVGDATGPRQIASGLRAHYSLEEMSGRRVVVITNLKPRPLVGFTSAGMVLAATAPDTGKVELLAPPPGAAVGERVTFAGHIGEAADFKKVRGATRRRLVWWSFGKQP
jgi:aminoacyl tRNA synthase complex-interacting multifunctional protein 1